MKVKVKSCKTSLIAISVVLFLFSIMGCSEENSTVSSQTTELEIEVYDGESEEGAIVKLYKSFDDWNKETNLVKEGTTDSEGLVLFQDLEDIEYYVDAVKECRSNWQSEFKTQKLIENVKNTNNQFIGGGLCQDGSNEFSILAKAEGKKWVVYSITEDSNSENLIDQPAYDAYREKSFTFYKDKTCIVVQNDQEIAGTWELKPGSILEVTGNDGERLLKFTNYKKSDFSVTSIKGPIAFVDNCFINCTLTSAQ